MNIVEQISPDADARGVRWYVVHTQPRAEMVAAAHLRHQGFFICCPVFEKLHRHARKERLKKSPLFPGYLFVSLDIHRDRWRCVNGTNGVIRLLMQNELPQAVPEGVVESIIDSFENRRQVDERFVIGVGDVIRVQSGPFADLLGTIDRCDGMDRVRVLLDIMGRSVTVVMQTHTVSLA